MLLVAAGRRDDAGREAALGLDDEDVARGPGVDERIARDRDASSRGDGELDGPEFTRGVRLRGVVAELHANTSRARLGVDERIDEVDLRGRSALGVTGRDEAPLSADAHGSDVRQEDVGDDVDLRQIGDLEERHLRRHVRTEHHVLLRDESAVRRGDGDRADRLALRDHALHLRARHAEQLELPAGGGGGRTCRCAAIRSGPLDRREELVLCLQDLRAVDGEHGLSGANRHAGLVDVHRLDEPWHAHVHLADALLRRHHESRDAQARRERTVFGDGRAYADRLDAVERESHGRRPRRDAAGKERARIDSGEVERIDRTCDRHRSDRSGHRARSREGLERHVTDRALTRLIRDDLRVHRAVVLGRVRARAGLGGGELRSREREPHERRQHRRGDDDDPAHAGHHLHATWGRLLAFGHRVVLGVRRRLFFSGHECLPLRESTGRAGRERDAGPPYRPMPRARRARDRESPGRRRSRSRRRPPFAETSAA